MNPHPSASTESNGPRVETLATRLSSTEMRAVEAAAQASEITRSEWHGKSHSGIPGTAPPNPRYLS